MAPPAGKTFALANGATDDNTMGMVTSAGELGFIHTGIESSYQDLTTKATVPTGVPWRTLRLQPNSQDTKVVPDWAFMDLFTAPVIVPTQASGIFAPHETTAAGRININALAQPYGDVTLFSSPLQRITPLVALLTGVPKDLTGTAITATEAKTIAQNIYNHTLATKGKSYPGSSTLATVYDSPGEVVEISGVADKGEESEAVIRGIANLITARGSVFTIYSIGQSLQQTRTGGLRVTAEQRHQTMLERYESTTTSSSIQSPSSIRFRKVAFQNLSP